MADFSIGKVGRRVGNIQKTYNWSLDIKIPQEVKDAMNYIDKPTWLEDVVIHCRSTSIPGRSFDVVTTKFGGIEQFFPTAVHYSNPFNVVFEEFEDKKIATMLFKWQGMVHRAIKSSLKKSNYAVNAELYLLEDEDLTLETNRKKLKIIEFNNLWPESVAEVPLDYGNSDSVKYSVAFRYDTWEYKKSGGESGDTGVYDNFAIN